MPYFVPPRNDESRLTFSSAALETSKADRLAANSYLSMETETALATFVPQLKNAYESLSSTLTARSREARQRREAVTKLEMNVLDVWEGVRRRARRLDHSVEVLSYYGLPMDGVNIKPTTTEGWISVGGRVVKGDVDAIAAGYSPICNPSAADVQAAIDNAQAETTEAKRADRVYDDAQAAMSALREEANNWIEEVMADLRYNLRRLDNESQRRIMRSYGATFAYLEGETPDPDDQEGATA